jgi:hypothetical protein
LFAVPIAHGHFSETWVNFMDAERINAIGNSLNDLHKRVDELRGYL